MMMMMMIVLLETLFLHVQVLCVGYSKILNELKIGESCTISQQLTAYFEMNRNDVTMNRLTYRRKMKDTGPQGILPSNERVK